MMSEDRRQDAQRVVDDGAIGFAWAGLPEPYYVHFSRLTRAGDSPDIRLIEVTFNPEWVEIGGEPFDLIIWWGSRPAMITWAEQLLVELRLELAPLPIEARFREHLFDRRVPRSSKLDYSNPWSLRVLDGGDPGQLR